MEDVKKYILSLAEVGLYKARVEEGGKELIFADNKFEERTLPGKAGAFDETEEISVIDLKKEKELARETKSREKKVAQEAEIEEERKSFRVSPTKKWFRAAIFAIPVIAAAVIFLLTNPPGEEKIDLNPQKTGSGVQVKKVESDTPLDTDSGLTDIEPGEITEGDITGEAAKESRDTEAGTTEGGDVTGQPGDESGEPTDKPAVETTGPGVKTGETDAQPPEGKKPGIDIKKETPEAKQPVKTPVDPGAKTPTIQTVKINRLPVGQRTEYNTTLSKVVFALFPVDIKVTGYLNVKISVDDKGNASAKILSSEDLKVTPEKKRGKTLNLIIKKISSLKLTPPKDRRGKPVRVSVFIANYQAGKFGKKLILKKR